jgi:hypothetical protein
MVGLLIGGDQFSCFLRGWSDEPFVIFIEVEHLRFPEFLDFHFFGVESFLFELFLIDFFLLFGAPLLPEPTYHLHFLKRL